MQTAVKVTLSPPDGRTFEGPPWGLLRTQDARAIAQANGHRMNHWSEVEDSALREYYCTCDCGADLRNMDTIGWNHSSALTDKCPILNHTAPLVSDDDAWKWA